MFLNPIKHVKYNFTYDFFQKSLINPFYESLVNLTNNKVVLNKDFNTKCLKRNTIHEVIFIPSFFSLSLNSLNVHYKVVKSKRINNYLINLDGYSNSNEYLKSVMTPKHIKQLRSRNRRLKTCFNISYKSYFGEISESDYKFLFNKLKKLIERRFRQRGDNFFLEDKWDYLIENTFQLILEKKVSFFVIYDEEKPISISLNYHFQNIAQSFISSYDIDYSKFGIGHVAILKKIEWCFANSFKILDLMWGKVPHKILWSNSIREYEHHFIYKNNHILKSAYVKLLIMGYKIKDSMKQKNILELFDKMKRYHLKSFQYITEKRKIAYKIDRFSKMPSKDNITKIDITSDQYAFLRKPVYDFQYLNFEPSANVMVFKDNIDDNSYLIKGIKSHIKVLVISN